MAIASSILADFQALLATSQPPDLGPNVRAQVETAVALNRQLDELFLRHALHAPKSDLLRALVLLWHDHLDEAHRIVQDLPGADAAFIHAIMHRREPDYWNSKYWWRRVGQHPAFTELTRRADERLSDDDCFPLKSRLLPGGVWDPFAFVDACEEAAGRGGSVEQRHLLRALQQLESETLLAHGCPSD